MNRPTDTWIACLTPPGQAALATLAVCGPRAWEAVRPLFLPRSGTPLPAEPSPGRIVLGRLGGEVADEVVLTIRRGGSSPLLELHCHGGRANVHFLLDLLAGRGLRVCDWREFLCRTEPDPLRAAAAVSLAEAPTVRTAAILLDQYHGAFAAALDAVAATLDRGDVSAASADLAALARVAPLGRRLTRPWRVAVAGPPNVGKSSLVNALVGFQRSIVAATPGTTRDVVKTRLAIDGWPVELADTAGVRDATGVLETQGVRMAREATAAADLCLWVLDGSAAPVWPDFQGAVQSVVNKIDLPPAWDPNTAAGAVRVSARTGEGMDELCAALSRRLVPDPPPAGAAVPFTGAFGDSVLAAQGCLRAGQVEEGRRAIERLRQTIP